MKTSCYQILQKKSSNFYQNLSLDCSLFLSPWVPSERAEIKQGFDKIMQQHILAAMQGAKILIDLSNKV